ncbi:unnamed protein product [[Candida] boidinii]|uniref:Unnamed protein product n=1 Tax=Candida boidinii TaxID=5477 RepID=A0A9W6SWV4_CANBO|nr:hypothetical protein BVG19_g346 [[Candida] boidinii]OWB49535.1 hypothetical protein B5S27_g1076 [[Candida] boidinii]OWB65414.1 hypothetical protein B5S30_g738 [[Candida] boidinii]OWB81922.1 hypothetical protein B5S33_g542 [[Candida] boidinii]GME68514.1 unnamed protein product [[Candida] boidinii]
MSGASRNSVKALFENLAKQMELFSNKTFEHHQKEAIKKQNALIQYKRLQYLRSGKQLSKEEDLALVNEIKQSTDVFKPQINIEFLQHLNKEDIHDVSKDHLNNITVFLQSQREYCELLERYNPGISMKQEDKVRKTARRVGLDIPE